MLAIRLSAEIEERLAALAERTGRTTSRPRRRRTLPYGAAPDRSAGRLGDGGV